MREEMLLTEEGYLLARKVAYWLKQSGKEKSIAVVKRMELEKFIGETLKPAKISDLTQAFIRIIGVKITSEMDSLENEWLTFTTIEPNWKKLRELEELRKKRNATPIIIA